MARAKNATKKKRKMNDFFKKLMAAKKKNAISFDYKPKGAKKTKTYCRQEKTVKLRGGAETLLVYYKAR